MSYRENYENWLNSPALAQEEKAELEAIRMDEKEIESRFFDQLAFGTAGLRGTMGVGLYRMNVHVIRHATQAFAQVILEEGPEAAARGVAVCFDCRNNSGLFAREAAAIRAKLPPSAVLAALCVEGRMRSSEELAQLVGTWEQSSAKHLVFLIGGSYGLHPSIKAEAQVKLSMSPMTFPHHLARVMLLEQLYRAFKIREGSSYHK